MSSNTKILVLHSKTLLCTLLLLFAGILITILLFSAFVAPSENAENIEQTTPSDTSASEVSSEKSSSEDAAYIPGVYSTCVKLGSAHAEIKVYLDANHINHIELVNLDESVATMYPLMSPLLNELASKVIDAQSVENITYSTENKYTSLILLNAINNTINKGCIQTQPITLSEIQ